MASVITIAGEQLFAAKAQANEQLDIDTFIFANVPNQDPSAPINREEGIPTAHIVYQQNVQQVGRINDNVVVYSTVLDSITGPFEFNWVGLYSSVNQKLVAINHVPTVTKTATAPGEAGNTLNRNFGIEYSGIAALTNITVDAETWQLNFTARLSGMDLLTQQLAADMNGKDWFIADGLKVVPRTTANTFSVTPGVGYVSGLRVELKQEHILIVQSYPQFVYVDAWFSGNANSTWSPQLAFTVTNTEMDDYIDPSGAQHYVYKLAVINAADDVKDLREDNKQASKEWVNESADKSFEELNDLINSTYRVEGKTVYLKGRFVKNDGGAAFYKLTKDAISNGVWIHDIGGGWFAQLEIDGRGVSVVTLGMNPESNDNKDAWIAINSLGYFKNVTVPNKIFKISQFVPRNINIRAEVGAKFEFIYTTTPVFASFKENVNIYDLWMHSTVDSLEWQRTECAETHDVNIYRGKISGFIHDSSIPNAWGIYFANAKRCYLHDVEFEDNGQADVAIVDGNEDIGIYRPRHTTDELIVNLEPNDGQRNKRIEVSGFKAKKLYLLVNTRTSNPLTEILIKTAEIDELFYDGADVSFENVDIKKVYGDPVQYFTGSINAVNSFGIGDNLLIDPNLVVVGANSGNWVVDYSSINPTDRYALFKHENFIGVKLNPKNLNGTVNLRSKDVEVIGSKTYYIHITGMQYLPVGAGFGADAARVKWYDAGGILIASNPIRPFRVLAGEVSAIRSEGVFITAPANAVKCKVFLANAFDNTNASNIITAITMHELRLDSNKFNAVLDKYHTLSVQPRTVYKSEITSEGFNYQLPMLLNDVISIDASKSMFRCIDDSHLESTHWVGIFKEI